MTVAVEFIVKVRPRRKAGRTDIADHLPTADMLTRTHRNTAHMTIAGAETAAMIELHIVAVAPGTAGGGDNTVAHGVDGRAITTAEVDATVHAAIAENGVSAHPEGR